ncbi:MAG: sorbosone dehydrogenase family protein [Anaerolineae bacterium]|nr:sorbosone dehydrogenase family protein [Anaerolineae bacterium]
MKRLLIGIALLLTALVPAEPAANAQTALPLNNIRLPAGFKIEVYASGIPNARSMTFGANGTLFVGSRSAGKVYAVTGGLGATKVSVIASGLNQPNGVAFRDGALYVAEQTRVIRFDNIEANLAKPPRPVVVNANFPSQSLHGWKFIKFGPDGKLYVPVGAPCNICQMNLNVYGTIMRMNPDGSGLEVYATGIRNTVGFDWNPSTGALWFTDNGIDTLGDDIPPDELNQAAQAGMNFGFPFCHGGVIVDRQFGAGHTCTEFTPPVQALGAHVAALGMRFYTGSMFPVEYQNQIFIAEHGSESRSVPDGYRVTLVRLDGSGRAVSYESFAEGWLQGNTAWGRPVDVQVMADGSLLVSDDRAGAIYRISYGQ